MHAYRDTQNCVSHFYLSLAFTPYYASIHVYTSVTFRNIKPYLTSSFFYLPGTKQQILVIKATRMQGNSAIKYPTKEGLSYVHELAVITDPSFFLEQGPVSLFLEQQQNGELFISLSSRTKTFAQVHLEESLLKREVAQVTTSRKKKTKKRISKRKQKDDFFDWTKARPLPLSTYSASSRSSKSKRKGKRRKTPQEKEKAPLAKVYGIKEKKKETKKKKQKKKTAKSPRNSTLKSTLASQSTSSTICSSLESPKSSAQKDGPTENPDTHRSGFTGVEIIKLKAIRKQLHEWEATDNDLFREVVANINAPTNGCKDNASISSSSTSTCKGPPERIVDRRKIICTGASIKGRLRNFFGNGARRQERRMQFDERVT